MVILWCCLLSRQELLRVRFYVFVQIDQIAWYTAASCLMRRKKVSPQLATKKRYIYLEASANATMIALANTKNKTERYPETEDTLKHTRIFSRLFLRDWNIPQQCQAACSSASFTCLFLTLHSYLSSCSSGSLLLAISTTDSELQRQNNLGFLGVSLHENFPTVLSILTVL